MARKKYILRYTDAVQLQRQSTDAVMITADVLTAHLGYTGVAQLHCGSSDAVAELVLRFSV